MPRQITRSRRHPPKVLGPPAEVRYRPSAPAPAEPPGRAPQPTTGRTRSRLHVAATIGILLIALAVRAGPVTAALPYSSYVDENHVAGAAARTVATRSADSGFYAYPSGLILSSAAGAVALSAFGDGPEDLRADSKVFHAGGVYGTTPVEYLLAGRLVVLLLSVGTVLLTILLGTRLAGRRVGVVSGLLLAFVPAAVSRSAIVITDTAAAFWVLLSLLLATSLAGARRPWAVALGTGAAAGAAAGTKYTVGVVMFAGLVAVALERGRSVGWRLRMAGLMGVGAGAAFLLAMPSVLTSPRGVSDAVRTLSTMYADKVAGSYWRDALEPGEVGWLLVVLAVPGLVLLVRAPRSRPATAIWAAFAVPFLLMMFRQSYQPFRNLIPVLPFLCIAAAMTLTAAAQLGHARGLSRPVADGALAAATLGVCAIMFDTGVQPYLDIERHRTDSRITAQEWFEQQPDCGEVLVVEELAFIPEELDEWPCDVTVASASLDEPASVDLTRYDYLVTGDFDDGVATWATAPATAPIARWGARPSPVAENLFRFPSQLVEIYALR